MLGPVRGAAAGVLFLLGAAALAQEPPEQLPPPREMPSVPPPIVMPVPPGPNGVPPFPVTRMNRWDLPQYRAVDPYNPWMPRMALPPDHAYYLRYGSPYPFVITHSWETGRIILGPPPPSGVR